MAQCRLGDFRESVFILGLPLVRANNPMDSLHPKPPSRLRRQYEALLWRPALHIRLDLTWVSRYALDLVHGHATDLAMPMLCLRFDDGQNEG